MVRLLVCVRWALSPNPVAGLLPVLHINPHLVVSSTPYPSIAFVVFPGLFTMSVNWVMLAPNGYPPFVALPHETLLHTTNGAISLSIQSGKSLPAGDARKKMITCSIGTAYLTNLRVRPSPLLVCLRMLTNKIVYLPEKLSSSAEFQSFSVPVKRVSDSHITQRGCPRVTFR